jgi:hypothetical protein
MSTFRKGKCATEYALLHVGWDLKPPTTLG